MKMQEWVGCLGSFLTWIFLASLVVFETQAVDLPTKPSHEALLDPQCIEQRIVFDIGSAQKKASFALVDRCQKRLLHTEYRTLPVPYQKDLQASQQRLFSDKILMEGTRALRVLLSYLRRHVRSDYPLEICGFATEAFRTANNRHVAVDTITRTMGAPFYVIDQKTEGLLAFHTAIKAFSPLQQQGNRAHLPVVVWDTGGGSIQLTMMHPAFPDDIRMVGARFAAQSIIQTVMDQDHHRGQESVYPFSSKDYDHAYRFVSDNFDALMPGQWEGLVDRATVIGVSPGHRAALELISHLLNRPLDWQEGFSRQDLRKVIGLMLDKDVHFFQDLSDKVHGHQNFLDHIMVNMVLFEAVMDKLGIDRIAVGSHRSVDHILLEGCGHLQHVQYQSLTVSASY